MLVNRIRIIAQCNECGNDEFYSDNEGTFFCTSCGEQHEIDCFNLGIMTIDKRIEIDVE